MATLMRFYLPVCIQLVVAGLIGLVIIAFDGESSKAWFSGSLLAVSCNAWFIFRAVATEKVRSSHVVVALANRGLLEKYVLAASGFAVIFVILKPYTPLLVFVGYGAIAVVQGVIARRNL